MRGIAPETGASVPSLPHPCPTRPDATRMLSRNRDQSEGGAIQLCSARPPSTTTVVPVT